MAALGSHIARPPDAARVIPIVTQTVTPRASQLWMLLAYNSGRLATYSLLGALVGTMGSAALLLQQVAPIERLLFGAAHLFMVLIGLYLLGLLPALARIEALGVRLWRWVQPALSRVLPANTVPRAMGLGLLWGFVPCGMVYTMLLTALVSGSAWRGALVMLVFGLGTLPNLLGLGLLAMSGRRLMQGRVLRGVAGTLVVGLGVLGIYHATLPVGGLLDTLCAMEFSL